MSDIEEAKREVKIFIQDLERFDLIKFPNPELRQMFIKSQHRAEITHLNELAHSKIHRWRRLEEVKSIPDNEWVSFNKKTTLNHMRENSEELKTFLKAMIDPQKIDSSVNELGKYLNNVYDKVEYDQDRRKKMNSIFFKDFRNALSHLDYDISLDSITWRDGHRNTTTWNNNYLLSVMTQMNAVMEEIGAKISQLISET